MSILNIRKNTAN
ncbi:unnamed protein product [Acanthoscelides obtectus]|uniref:Uncharacterized protein n=1 Tax=Acanthoscelides obtectus TaxID=200917 RepID=A0A9P0JSA4_ACAOB|nr:unnamed protein product [Acanthoscelides obtectus]CAK1625526.1 hypothetical protein AOBTE_LOCUS3212 [Acanthoscelides obtectus]